MKRIIPLLVIGILFTNCSDDKEDCCVTIDTGISIKYLNSSGENLFAMDNGPTESDITIYHRENGVWQKYHQGNLDHPKGIMTLGKGDETYLMVFPSNIIVENNCSETKIEFSDPDLGSDILKAEIDRDNSNEIVTKVWYNGALKWESHHTERMFEIIK